MLPPKHSDSYKDPKCQSVTTSLVFKPSDQSHVFSVIISILQVRKWDLERLSNLLMIL